jgi:glycosyltransferase involved in cell wall biosynthesis
MIDDTGGGVLCEPGDPASLAAALKRMILDPDFAAQCGRRAQQVVHERYNAAAMAERMVELYESVVVSG